MKHAPGGGSRRTLWSEGCLLPGQQVQRTGPFLVLGTGLLTYIMQAFKFPKSIYSAWTEKRVREWEKNDLNSTDYLPTNPFSELLPIEKQCEMRDAWDLG